VLVSRVVCIIEIFKICPVRVCNPYSFNKLDKCCYNKAN
jgi:hypothetical protein